MRELYSLIEVLLKSKNIHGLMVLGEAGIGKSYSVLNYLEDNDVTPSVLTTYSTPLSLYMFLYKHKDDALIVMDDVDNIWENDHSAATLKSAMWSVDEDRKIEWNSTSKLLEKEGIPDTFYFNSKIIFICNKTRDNPNVDAVLSRVLHFKITYTREEKISQMRDICKSIKKFNLTLKEKGEVVDLISEFASLFDFRTLMQGLEIRELSKESESIDWRKTFLSILESDVNNELKFVYNKSKESVLPVEEQVAEFKKMFGKSRRTFFYLKKKLVDSGCL